jgi:hypothetical protein
MSTWPILPRKYDRQRGSAEPLQCAVTALDGDVDGEILNTAEQDARGDHARQVIGGLRDAARAVGVRSDIAGSGERDGEDRQHHDREEEGEEDGVTLAEVEPGLICGAVPPESDGVHASSFTRSSAEGCVAPTSPR